MENGDSEMSGVDWTCKRELESNFWAYQAIKEITTKEDVVKWSEALKGLRPRYETTEQFEDWVSGNAWRYEKLKSLNELFKSMIKKFRISRTLFVCVIRQLQKDYGARVNFNFFKDDALKDLFKSEIQVKRTEKSLLSDIVRDFSEIENLEYTKESSIDLTCRRELEDNQWVFQAIKERIAKKDLLKWTKKLIGLRPISTNGERYEDWISDNAWRREQLRSLNVFIKSMVKNLKISRMLAVCIIRELQKEYGTRVNFNFFKDDALKDLFKSEIEEYVAVYDVIELKLIAKKFELDEDEVEDILLTLINSERIRGNLTSVNGVKTFQKTKEPLTISREVGGSTKYFSVPNECPHCGQFLTAQEYNWVDMMKVKCTNCGGVIEVETKDF